MQDSLRLVFILSGIAAIGALLFHGYWSNRKKRLSNDVNENTLTSNIPSPLAPDIDGFDGDGIGQVRTVTSGNRNQDNNLNNAAKKTKEPVIKEPYFDSQNLQVSEEIEPQIKTPNPNRSVESQGSRQNIAQGITTNNVSITENESFSPPPKHLLKQSSTKNIQPSKVVSPNLDITATTTPKESIDLAQSRPSETIVEAPKFVNDSKPLLKERAAQIMDESIVEPQEKVENIISSQAKPVEISPITKSDCKVQATKNAIHKASEIKKANEEQVKKVDVEKPISTTKNQSSPVAAPQDVYILNVAAKEGAEIEGAKLLPILLRLGMKYGDMNIFHRHQDAAGNGNVLFSLANMVKPGIFDLDTIEQFSTKGISLFFTVPCYGSASNNFKLMLQASQKLANALDAQLLDQHRNPLNDQAIRHTMHKVVEYERQQLLEKKHG